MRYRTLGRTGLQVSEIGLGTEYLDKKSREEVTAVIHAAIEGGVNYFDLIWAHPEVRDHMGAAFAGHRERVLITAHLGCTSKDGQYKKTRALKASERFFDDALERCRTGHVDVLFLHNCDSQKDFDAIFRENGQLGLALRLRDEGRARCIGFSGHTVATARQAVESGHVDVLMFPINLAGNAVPGKKALLATCAERGVGVVAMKPYGGGKLLNGPRTVRVAHYQSGGDAFKVRKETPITPALCLAYTLSQVGVCTAVPGCADVEQMQAALDYARATEDAAAAWDFSAVLQDFDQSVEGECVYCNHCLPCPARIDIGQTIRLLEMAQQRMTPELRAAYAALPAPAGACTQCGACERRCPFGVATMQKIEAAAAIFADP